MTMRVFERFDDALSARDRGRRHRDVLRDPGARRLARKLVSLSQPVRPGSFPEEHQGVGFAEFVEAYLARPQPAYAKIGGASRFVVGKSGKPAVTHMFRYDNIPGMMRFLEERLGEEIRLPKANVSPSRGSFSFRPRCGRGSRPSAPRTSRSMPISPGEAVAGTRSPMTPAPDFLCIGAQKAGTSWLDVMLRQHPGVFLPPMKEVHFYDFIYLPEHRGWIRAGFGKHLRQHGGRAGFGAYFARLAALPRRQDAWYAAVFDHPEAAGRVTGEITPAYSILPSDGVARVRATNPAMKIIFIVRDPVDRALSHLRMAANRRKDPRIDLAWLERTGPELLPAALARSAYRENVGRWEAVFPPEQLLFLPFGTIRSAPERLMAEVEGFLGLAPQRYAGLADSVYKTRPVEIDAGVQALLEDRLADERAWLAARFGAAWAA